MTSEGPTDALPARVALGVSASVALHRALDLCSELKKRKVATDVLMTGAAQRLVSPLFFQAFTHRKVHHELFELPRGESDDPYGHLAPAWHAKLLVMAPATADLIARLAQGLANDVPTTCALAFDGPRLLCPAMNWRMWRHPAVQRNVEILRGDGWELVGPIEGELACGEKGAGRLAPVEAILARIEALLKMEALED